MLPSCGTLSHSDESCLLLELGCIFFHSWLTQYSVSPFLIRIMPARLPKRAGYICREIRPFIQYSMSGITDDPWMLSIVLIASPKFVPNVFNRGCSQRIRRLIHLDDALLWENLGNCPGTMTCSIIVLMTSRPSTAWWRHQMEKTFCVTGLLCGEFTGHRWIPRTKASDAELWYFDLRLNQQLIKQWRRRWFGTPPHWLCRHCIKGRAGIGTPPHPTPLFPKSVYYNQGNVFYRMYCNGGYRVW